MSSKSVHNYKTLTEPIDFTKKCVNVFYSKTWKYIEQRVSVWDGSGENIRAKNTKLKMGEKRKTEKYKQKQKQLL